MDDTTTNNPFARVVLFYYTYLRSKLTAADLERIAKKYNTKPDKLLLDLGQKYSFVIPEYVYINEIHRLCSIFQVPACYSRLIPELPKDTEYDSHCDVYSPDFDALMSLQSGQISISYMKAPTLDNITKVFSILPGYVPDPRFPSMPAGIPALPTTNTTYALYSSKAPDPSRSSESTVPKSRHLFDLIAEASLMGKARRNGPAESADASPLGLLHQYMKKHERVRIILRRNNRYYLNTVVIISYILLIELAIW